MPFTILMESWSLCIFFHLHFNLFGALLILHPQGLEGNLSILCGISVILECILELSPQIFYYILQLQS